MIQQRRFQLGLRRGWRGKCKKGDVRSISPSEPVTLTQANELVHEVYLKDKTLSGVKNYLRDITVGRVVPGSQSGESQIPHGNRRNCYGMDFIVAINYNQNGREPLLPKKYQLKCANWEMLTERCQPRRCQPRRGQSRKCQPWKMSTLKDVNPERCQPRRCQFSERSQPSNVNPERLKCL